MEIEDQLLAFHEAGHAVVAWALGVELFGASISEGKGGVVRHKSFNFSIHTTMNFADDIEKARKQTMLSLGGKFAERALLEVNGRQPESFHDDMDMAEVESLALQLFGDDKISAKIWISECEDAVDKIIVKFYDRVANVADALLSAKSLTSDDLRKLFSKV